MGCRGCEVVFTVLVTVTTIFADSYSNVHGDFTGRWTVPLHRERRQVSTEDTFKYYWVTQCGYSAVNTDPVSIEVRATQRVSDEVVEKTARLVHRLVSFVSPTLFRRLSSLVAVGVYSHPRQDPSIFPEYKRTQDCMNSCEGNCSRICSDRGTPVAYEISYGGPLIVVPSENVDCENSNPRRFENLLVGEFSKSLLKYALTGQYREKLDEAFKDSPSIWGNGIPLDNYFRQATLSWFQSTKLYRSLTYGMNLCFGAALCPNERYSRNNLKQKDIKLYEVLNDIYNYGRSYIRGDVTLCEW